MAIQVKKFNFPPFDEWYNKKCYYNETIGKYEVDICKFFDYYAVFANFPLEHIKLFDFNEIQDMSLEEQLESFKVWYEKACVKVNEEFENYIRTYLVED